MRKKQIPVASLGLFLALAGCFLAREAFAAPAARTPVARMPTPQKPSLTAEETARSRKVLASAVEKRQAVQAKPAAGAPAAFQAHRCAILYDPQIFGKERESNGPFRTSCSDWVSRRTQSLAVKDAEQPCAVSQYGPSFVACASWVDHWDAGSAKWVSVWRQPTP